MAILPTIPPADIKQFFMPSTANLPEADQMWVKMDVSPKNVMDSLVVTTNRIGMAGLEMLTSRIKEWNCTEMDLSQAPINEGTVARLGQQNLNYLATQIKNDPISGLDTAEKKSSSSTLTP